MVVENYSFFFFFSSIRTNCRFLCQFIMCASVRKVGGDVVMWTFKDKRTRLLFTFFLVFVIK